MTPRERQKTDECAEKLADIDPQRYGWLKTVRSSKRADALCFVAVREFGRVDEAIGNIDDFCNWLHAAVRNTIDLGQRLLGGPEAKCSICHDDLAAADASLMPCSHFGHTQCLSEWLGRKPSCPECRSTPTHPQSLFPMRAIGNLAARADVSAPVKESETRVELRRGIEARRGARRAGLGRAKDAFLKLLPTTPPPRLGCVAAGEHHTVVLMADGSVRAFGSDGHGQLGGGSVSRSIPDIGNDAAQVAAGWMHMAVLMKDGSVRTFGYDEYGILGGGSVSKPIPEIGTNAVQVAAGGAHIVVLMKDGSVRAVYSFDTKGCKKPQPKW